MLNFDEAQNSFDQLKSALMNPPVLEFANFEASNSFILRTDASGFALGAILCNGNDKPVAYASRSLNNAERNYCTIEKELLAIVWAVKYFRPYLFGRKFTIFTDHKPLIYLFGMVNPSSRLTKFRLTLEEYDFVIKYVKGKDNAADALSRVELSSDELKTMESSITNTLCVLTRSRLKQLENKAMQNNKADNSRDFSRLDHPSLVQILKKPFDACEIRPVEPEDFDNLIKRKHIYKMNNIIFEVALPIIYLNDTIFKSTSKFKECLIDIKNISDKYKIPELVIIKTEKCTQFLNKVRELSGFIKQLNIRISVINGVQIIKDKEIKQIILNDYHLLPTGGHSGINKLYNAIRKNYYWTGIRRDVEDFVRRCDECQRFKHSRSVIEPMEITNTPSYAFQKIFLDLVGPLETDVENYSYILTIQCDLTKFVEAYPLKNKETINVAKSFVSNFILRYGIPEQTVTDQGKEFVSELFSKTCQILGIERLTSTAYHHETLGSLENTHKHLGAYLRMQVKKYSSAWSTWLPFWCFSFNTAIHSETRYTPYELVFGKIACRPTNLQTNLVEPLYSFDNYPLELKYRLQQAHIEAHNNLIESKNKRKVRYDAASIPVTYKCGDLVLVKNIVQSKLDPLFKGPFEVVSVNNPNVTLKVDNKVVTVHKNRTKLYIS